MCLCIPSQLLILDLLKPLMCPSQRLIKASLTPIVYVGGHCLLICV